MLFIKKQYLVSQAHYSLTVKSSPVSIDKIKLLLLLLLLPGLQRRLKKWYWYRCNLPCFFNIRKSTEILVIRIHIKSNFF